MATITDDTPLLSILALKFQRSRRKKASGIAMNRVGIWLQALVRLLLTLSGFGFLTWGMFTWNIVAGLITAGLSCFVLAWLTKEPSQMDNGNGSPPRPDQYMADRGYS